MTPGSLLSVVLPISVAHAVSVCGLGSGGQHRLADLETQGVRIPLIHRRAELGRAEVLGGRSRLAGGAPR